MPSVKAKYKYLFLAVALLAAGSCSVEKNTGATRFYNGMTARYNIYFNGYESYKAGLLKVTNGYIDDYAEMLRVFEYSDPSTPSLCSADMEKAIQKASKLITLKSITAKPEKGEKNIPEEVTDLLTRKEYNEWVDDSYLLIGKARFYKQEYNEASSLLNYCITQANDQMIRKEASIWMARLLSETGKYSDAYRILNEMDIINGSSKSLEAMYFTTLADLFIKQKRFDDAVDPLTQALKLVSGKRARYRLTYLLAQLNEANGNHARAIALYREVVKMKPPYDVEFNARINIAGVFDVNSGNPQEMKRELEKMLKDIKNKDFLDQIYYALGSISMKEGNETEALLLFRQSAASPSRNPNQKSRTYLALAEFYYNKPDFIKAGKYYDSTVFFLDQKHPDYSRLRTKSQDLNSVVSPLEIIQTEDSLQRVASMSEAERNALITGIINDITKAESEGTASGYSDRYNLGQFYENERRFQNNIEQEGKWYFYNQAALTFGRTEFRRRWGDRGLEDNWRRSNKTRVSSSPGMSGADESTGAGIDTTTALPDHKNPQFYLRGLPLTDSLISVSNVKISNAYLNAGKAYAEKISDPLKATESLEMLLTRYPGSELVAEALYNLYNINKGTNSPKSETYRQRLLLNHPQSEFAMILSDPSYFEKKLADLRMAERMYNEAYELYKNEDFKGSMIIVDGALINYSKDALAPKFMLLRSYSVAKTNDERTFKEELNKIIEMWPASEESKKASELIAFINQQIPELKIEEEKEIAMELFDADTTTAHVFTLVILNPAFNINLASFDVISYNIDNYTNNNYRTQGELFDNKYLLITVSGFKDFNETMDYFELFDVQKSVRNPSSSGMLTFIINDENMTILKKDKNPERYLLFFKEYYLNEKD